MTNKELTNRLKNNAELAWAAYGYFHLANPNYKPHELDKDGKKLKQFREIEGYNNPSYSDILNLNYKSIFKGDFSPTQSKRFFEKYDLLKHCPNTNSGFSATLFKDTKADSKDSEYTLAIRGTEFKLEQIQDFINDYYIGTNNNDRKKA
ncbi:hypothetical protein LS66_004305 [Helicobacter sp. MIT 03-1614]|uniref:hypothetical protein n=1 Tax=Helicobacter sp. MIT 03-1614 TaxID=1548147 RepID=UPI0005144728|nr:hypothetical protein [Helicobacter sp. MIT 03-1614]TLD89537.1 hypothetical protein LS66_004305 [Helicobacter sp. MIT 03-1614]